ncbi:hypothetical protein [Ralstonia syzygii]|uniref:hypothetical protein n=1 Tax=Ralstonia syzygii TaxID=28097 RepID=UPI001E45DD6C|nr:hypothetical protein [Ralstonia syzygii]
MLVDFFNPVEIAGSTLDVFSGVRGNRSIQSSARRVVGKFNMKMELEDIEIYCQD